MSYFNQFLTLRHRAAGLSLEEIGDDFIQLKHQGKVLATFTQHTTIDAILHEANQQLCWLKSGVVFQKVDTIKGAPSPFRGDHLIAEKMRNYWIALADHAER